MVAQDFAVLGRFLDSTCKSHVGQVTEELARWPTALDVRVVSNKHARLNATFHSWGLPPTIQVVGAPPNLSHPYELAWIHRDLMKAAYDTGGLGPAQLLSSQAV